MDGVPDSPASMFCPPWSGVPVVALASCMRLLSCFVLFPAIGAVLVAISVPCPEASFCPWRAAGGRPGPPGRARAPTPSDQPNLLYLVADRVVYTKNSGRGPAWQALFHQQCLLS